MIFYKTLSTSKNLPEYHLYNDKNILDEDLIKKLKELNFNLNDDYKLIYTRGYEMFQSIRFIKSKMVKNEFEIIKTIEKWLLTKEKYLNLESNLYYPMIGKMFKETII
jgi:hypothetical protein